MSDQLRVHASRSDSTSLRCCHDSGRFGSPLRFRLHRTRRGRKRRP